MQTLHTLHVITGLEAHGAEMALYRLLASLKSPEFHHTVVALGAEAELSGKIGSLAELHHLGMHPGRMTPLDFLRLRRLLGRQRHHLTQGWMYHANFMLTIASMGLGLPMVWGMRQSLYSLAQEKQRTRWVIQACAYLSRRPERIVYNSRASRAQHAKYGFYDSRGLVVANGFDTNDFSPDPAARFKVRAALGIAQDALAIGLVARVHPMKDHTNYLQAAARFAVDYPNAVFILVGDGADESNPILSDLIDNLRLRSKVRLCGRRTDTAALNCALDIACSSSWGEGFSNAIAEAMACGTPCVATNVGDTRDIIGDTGIVVPPRNPAALSEGWAKLAALGAEGRRDLGLRARQRIIDRYSLAANAEAYAGLYRSLVSGN